MTAIYTMGQQQNTLLIECFSRSEDARLQYKALIERAKYPSQVYLSEAAYQQLQQSLDINHFISFNSSIEPHVGILHTCKIYVLADKHKYTLKPHPVGKERFRQTME